MKARALGVSLAWTLFACGGDERPAVALPTTDACLGRPDGLLCSSGAALTCAEGKVAARDDCAAQSLICAPGVGCRTCEPYSVTCEGNARYVCAADGSRAELTEACADGLWCSAAGCADLCADAARARSYLGCDYWPVFTQNSQLASPFVPAVAIGNGNLVSAHVVITKGARVIAERDVPARSSLTVELAYEAALQRSTGTSLVRQGAYHLRASVPVTVHQFNPLLFELPADCPDEEPEFFSPSDDSCNSFTNDASLLFPSTALAPEAGETEIVFLAAARATATFRPFETPQLVGVPGFVAIVAIGERPTRVRVRTSAHTLASSAAGGAIEALAPGGLLERTLEPGDVLQILSAAPTECTGAMSGQLCDPGPAYDLTGTEVRADGPVQVIGGHDCTYVPFDVAACDHLEESIPPLRTWGTATIVTRPRTAANAAHMLRVVSGADQNEITFDPPIHEPITLAKGAFVELLADQPVFVRGKNRILIAQYLTGQNQGRARYVGDPSMSIGVPVAQYRGTYNFLTPATYSINYVDIVAPTGDVVTLDDKLVGGFVPVGASGFSVTYQQLSTPGAHELRSVRGLGQGLGVVLYGLAPYTSYMLPGGLDLAPVEVPVI